MKVLKEVFCDVVRGKTGSLVLRYLVKWESVLLILLALFHLFKTAFVFVVDQISALHHSSKLSPFLYG
jgi:hypothetical protein